MQRSSGRSANSTARNFPYRAAPVTTRPTSAGHRRVEGLERAHRGDVHARDRAVERRARAGGARAPRPRAARARLLVHRLQRAVGVAGGARVRRRRTTIRISSFARLPPADQAGPALGGLVVAAARSRRRASRVGAATSGSGRTARSAGGDEPEVPGDVHRGRRPDDETPRTGTARRGSAGPRRGRRRRRARSRRRWRAVDHSMLRRTDQVRPSAPATVLARMPPRASAVGLCGPGGPVWAPRFHRVARSWRTPRRAAAAVLWMTVSPPGRATGRPRSPGRPGPGAWSRPARPRRCRRW